MKNNLIEQFFSLVKIDSPTGHEQNVADYIVNYLTPLVDVVKKDKHGNVYAYISGAGKPVFFASHMDTVEPGRGIKPVRKGKYIISDGTTILGADNKAALASMLELASLLKSKKISHVPVEFIFTHSEESGNYGASSFDYRQLRSRTGYCFDSNDEKY